MIARSQAFTLFEMITVLGVLLLLLTMSVPSLKDFTNRMGCIHDAEKLLSVLRIARLFALQNHHTVMITPLDNKNGQLINWQKGLVAYDDIFHDRKIHHESQILISADFLKAKSLRFIGYPKASFLQFSPLGSAQTNGSFILCYQSVGRKIVVNRAGEFRVSDYACL